MSSIFYWIGPFFIFANRSWGLWLWTSSGLTRTSPTRTGSGRGWRKPRTRVSYSIFLTICRNLNCLLLGKKRNAADIDFLRWIVFFSTISLYLKLFNSSACFVKVEVNQPAEVCVGGRCCCKHRPGGSLYIVYSVTWDPIVLGDVECRFGDPG